jgi:uncharacterized LabA/DUF88 family protein
LFAQGGVALSGHKQPRTNLSLDAVRATNLLRSIALSKAQNCSLLRIYWYDGAVLGNQLTPEQSVLAKLDDVKVRLGFINTAGQQKGVDSLIVTDLIELARQKAICDALLLSGDEDVRIGVQIAQNYGVRVHLLGIHPSRGSQSVQLIHEADTSEEWQPAMIAGFLSLRAVPGASSTLADASLPAFDQLAKALADSLLAPDIAAIIAYFGTARGIPPEYDGRLLAAGRVSLGRDLEQAEKRQLRASFRTRVNNLQVPGEATQEQP